MVAMVTVAVSYLVASSVVWSAGFVLVFWSCKDSLAKGIAVEIF